MNRSAKGLLIVTILATLDGFSLANCRRFAKFAKLSTRQTFPLYSITPWNSLGVWLHHSMYVYVHIYIYILVFKTKILNLKRE